jgi:serine/threonine-protein kinase
MSAPAPPSYLPAGTRLLGRYEVLGEIGRGGYSVVYAARDHALDADIAIKLLVPPPALANVARERMRREVQAVRGLAHAHIVGVHDFCEEGPWSFVVMERVHGPDLLVRLRERGPLSSADAVRLGREIASALAEAHGRGILHRDVKPQNILLDRDGRARLTDFGSARLEGQHTVTQTGALVGTLAYAAPELIAGRRGDARSDIYALGVTLYHALLGRLPGRASPHLPPAPAAEGYRVRAARTDVPEWLDDAIAAATAADPAHRFPGAESLRDALAGHLPSGMAPLPARLPGQTCVLCGAPEPLGLIICARCGGATPGPDDTLVVLRRPVSALEHEEAPRRLASLVGARGQSGAGRAAARGERALLALPRSAAPRVVERLMARDLPARAMPVGQAYRIVSPGFYGLAGAIFLVGGIASGGLPLLGWTSPVVAALLLFGAERAARAPLLAPARRARWLPAPLEQEVAEALAALGDGTGRDLFADVVRLAQIVIEGATRTGDERGLVPMVTAMVDAARAFALDLARVEHTLAALDDQGDRAAVRSPALAEAEARAERARDAMVQRLLDAVSALSRLCGQAIDDAASAERVGDLTRELESEARARAAAARELEALLGS